MKICKGCQRSLPLKDFAHDHPRRGDGGYLSGRCRACRNQQKRASKAARLDPEHPVAVNRAVHMAPDPTPAIRLREELARRREQGEHFDTAWTAALRVVLADVPSGACQGWHAAFRWARPFFFDAWYGGRIGTGLGSALFVADDLAA